MRHGVPGLLVCLLLLPVLGLAAPDAGAAEHDDPTFWLGLAEGYAQQITVPDGRAALLVSIGTGYVEAGAKDRAIEMLAAAVEYGSKCTGCYAKATRLADIGLLLTKAGNPLKAARAFDAAKQAAAELEDVVLRISALCAVAERRAEAGDVMPARIALGEVEKLATALEGPARIEAYAALLSAWVQVGEGVKARAAYEPIRRARTRGTAEERQLAIDLSDPALFDLVVGATRAKEFELAKERATVIADDELRVAAWLMMARGLEKSESKALAIRQAAEFASTVATPTTRATLNLDVASAADALGDKEVASHARNEAYFALGSVPPSMVTVPMVELLLTFAEQTRQAGEADMARGALVLAESKTKGVAERENVDGLRRMLARDWARAGEIDRALKTVREIEDVTTRVLARLDVVEAVRCTGDVKTAIAILKELPKLDPATRGEVLRRISVQQAGCGQYDLALKTVKSMERPFQAATACTFIARDLTP